MSGIQTNFRAEDMLGGAKKDVVVEAPKKVAAPKPAAKKSEPKVAPAPVVETVDVVVEEPVVEVEASEE